LQYFLIGYIHYLSIALLVLSIVSIIVGLLKFKGDYWWDYLIHEQVLLLLGIFVVG